MATISFAQQQIAEEGSWPGSQTRERPRVVGKFLFSGAEKLYIRGVTYGPFHPNEDGELYRDPGVVKRDFACMSRHGINAIRTYTIPPIWLLDAAWQNGLWVMAGIPWEQHIAFLDDSRIKKTVQQRVRNAVRNCAAHPAILGFTIGNEIPASIVRWHGHSRIERFLEQLYLTAKQEDSSALVTYVNFPSTEYLQLDFLDFLSFNVYLERQDRLEAYLARLQNLAGNRPLVMAEVGLDSCRNGTARQAEVLDWQIRTVFSSGCGGVFVFSWTDEWSRGGFEIQDWDFGLVSRSREPKPALHSVTRALQAAPFGRDRIWPRISVVICSYNGERTIGEAISEVLKTDYPDYELIVVNDGSQDDTAQIAGSFPGVRVLTTENGGLSAARNLGMHAATGEIIAYLDDDAYPDPDWLHYLALAFERAPHVAIGGPNIPPPGDGLIAECVANAPGGPIHVLLTDEIAEHIPGCNFAVRRTALEKIGGFDPIYRVAGDDVDACWRLRELGTIGFAPAALVWHHRRNSIPAYWRQQKGYGRAEALLERKWPLKYNAAGHLAWCGQLYGLGRLRRLWQRGRIYHGTWASASFQALYEPAPGFLQSVTQTPEWYLVVLALAGLSTLGILWRPLFAALPLLSLAIALPIAQAVSSARRAQFSSRPVRRTRMVTLTAVLFAIQPVARLWGRLSFGLAPWRRRSGACLLSPGIHERKLWSEKWWPSERWLQALESKVFEQAFARRGGDFDNWDLHIRGGLGGSARVRLGVEEHGAGRQLLRWRIEPIVSWFMAFWASCFCILSIIAAHTGCLSAMLGMASIALGLTWWIYRDCSIAFKVVLDALRQVEEDAR